MEPESIKKFDIQINDEDLGHLQHNIYDQLIKDAAESMRVEMDNQIMISVLSEVGMHYFPLSSPKLVSDAKEWCDQFITHKWVNYNTHFLFTSEQDYNWFILKWGNGD